MIEINKIKKEVFSNDIMQNNNICLAEVLLCKNIFVTVKKK